VEFKPKIYLFFLFFYTKTGEKKWLKGKKEQGKEGN